MKQLKFWKTGWSNYRAIRIASVCPERVTVVLKGASQKPIPPIESPCYEAAKAIICALRCDEHLDVDAVLGLSGFQAYRRYIATNFTDINLSAQSRRFLQTVRHVAREQSTECLVRLSPIAPPRVIDGHHRTCIAAALRLPISLYVPIYRSNSRLSDE